MKQGVYYHPLTLKMVETMWIDEETITFWTWHSMKTGKGFMATSNKDNFKKQLIYLGEV